MLLFITNCLVLKMYEYIVSATLLCERCEGAEDHLAKTLLK